MFSFLLYALSCLTFISFQYVNAVEASQYDSRLKKKNKERKAKIQLLTAELTATKQHSQIAEARRKAGHKKDAEEIEKLKVELAKHQEDAATISDLRAQLEERAKDASRIKELDLSLPFLTLLLKATVILTRLDSIHILKGNECKAGKCIKQKTEHKDK